MCPPTLSQSSRLLQTQKAPFQYTELIEKPYLFVTIIIIFSSCKSSNMDMRRMKPKTKPKILPLDKKVPRNPKYENVKSTIDTGNNTRRKEERYEFLRPFFAFLNLLNSYFIKFKDHSPFKICRYFILSDCSVQVSYYIVVVDSSTRQHTKKLPNIFLLKILLINCLIHQKNQYS